VQPGGFRLELRGQQDVSEADLRDALAHDLPDFAEADRRRAAVDDGAYALELLCRSRGHPFARVEWTLTRAADGVDDVVYLVEEGPRTLLEEVRFEGNASLADATLRPLFFGGERLLGLSPTPYVESRVAAAVASASALYLGAGFLTAQVGPARVSFGADRTEARVVVPVREGLRHRVVRIGIEGDTALPVEELQLAVSDFLGQPYFPQVAYAARQRLIDRLGAAGHAQPRVIVSERRGPDGGDVELDFDVQAGPRALVEAVRVEGLSRTDEDFVRKRVALKPGDPWSAAAERESETALLRSGLFKRVRLALEPPAAGVDPHADAPAESRTLLVELEEGTQSEVFLEPGYGSYEGPRVVAGYRERNLYGQGLTLHAEGGLSAKARRLLVGLTDPWLMPAADISGDVSVFAGRREEPSFVRHEVGTALTLEQEFDPRHSVFYVYSLKRTSASDVEIVDDPAAEEADTVDISSIAVTPVHDSRDDPFAPTRGGAARATLELGSDALGGELDFVRGRIETSWFWPIGSRSVLAASFRTGAIVPRADTDDIPLQERFFNGGQDSVRSFREDELGPKDENGNPLGGEAFTVASVEWRRRLQGALEGALFVDAGNVESDYAKWAGLHDVSYGLGTGLRYLLPVGPVRLDVAWNPWPEENEDQWVAHLSVGMPF
jgi:outer membrane protein assembly complex protein YaeT